MPGSNVGIPRDHRGPRFSGTKCVSGAAGYLVAALTVHHLRIAGKLDTVPRGTQLEIPDDAYEPVGA